MKKYTSRDLIRAYRERSVYGSMTRNAEQMGMTVPSLSSLFNSLDHPTPKGLRAITKKAWLKIHGKNVSSDIPTSTISLGTLPQGQFKALEDIVSAFENDIADFITRVVDKKTKEIVNQSQRVVAEKDKCIDELASQVSDLKIIAEVAKKENRLVALTKKLFHED